MLPTNPPPPPPPPAILTTTPSQSPPDPTVSKTPSPSKSPDKRSGELLAKVNGPTFKALSPELSSVPAVDKVGADAHQFLGLLICGQEWYTGIEM
ncbi:hypothetical protein QVD17_04194 [Tagetes erecta]|uniref:Uncharacterized protein n=1 Tax=Tagetes erecta TaxID=13708 RepID=A0AAD8LG79_TARER|nr:hypothetical protein QVD17_04194 [Tagetes erecta]